MASRHYFLQAHLYAVALRRFLRWRMPDADPDASASGVEVHPETRSVTSTPADGEQPEA